MFNVSALRHYVETTIPGRRQPVTDLDGHSPYVVDKLLDHRTRHRRLQYLVKWAGYADATWEPANYLVDESGQDIVQLRQYKLVSAGTVLGARSFFALG